MGNGIGSSMYPPAKNVVFMFTRTHKKVDDKPGESPGQSGGQGLHGWGDFRCKTTHPGEMSWSG